MGEQASFSIPIDWRLHKDLWDKNRKSLQYQMKEAGLKLKKSEERVLAEEKIELVLGQLVTSVASE